MRNTFNFIVFVVVLIVLSVAGLAWWWVDQATVVAKDEFGPKVALEKYEWFIQQSNFIKKADADILLFEQKRTGVETQYVSTYGADKTTWSPSTQAQYNQAMQNALTDLTAVVSNRNALVADYNAASEKFNWAPFMSRTDLPPQTFQTYIVK